MTRLGLARSSFESLVLKGILFLATNGSVVLHLYRLGTHLIM